MKLEIDGLGKSFGSQRVIDALSLSITDVRCLVLIGPSGCGKSTLLRILGGLEASDAGEVQVNGEPLGRTENELLPYRRTIGTVFQAYNLFPHLTALENITLPLEKVHGRSPAKAREIAFEYLTRLRLEAHAGKTPAQLSGGQRQRVAIARALSIQPRLLLFDEPTSALDPEMTAEVLEVIAELRQEGRDLLLVTHQMAFARSVADHAVFMNGGKIVEDGAGAALFDAPREEGTKGFLEKVLRY
jgi:polar amino acid transport system ATP-binding protein